MNHGSISAVAILSISAIHPGDNLAEIIIDGTRKANIELANYDILVVASKIVSKSENRLIHASEVSVSRKAEEIAQRNNFDPIHVELALREASEIISSDGVLITQTHSGLICNFSGVDKSNAPEGVYVLLPEDPDFSAKRIRDDLSKQTGLKLAVIISDTQGRPWRKGAVNIAIGCAGINAFKHNKGKHDLYGRVLQRSSVCQVDELAALAEPLMGQAGERVPVVVLRGYDYLEGEEHAKDIIRPKKDDLFR